MRATLCRMAHQGNVNILQRDIVDMLGWPPILMAMTEVEAFTKTMKKDPRTEEKSTNGSLIRKQGCSWTVYTEGHA